MGEEVDVGVGLLDAETLAAAALPGLSWRPYIDCVRGPVKWVNG